MLKRVLHNGMLTIDANANGMMDGSESFIRSLNMNLKILKMLLVS
jgi:hypothetical protein